MLFMIPVVAAYLVSIAMGIVQRIRKASMMQHAGRRRRHDADLDGGRINCSKCGYDLRASPDRCPECGTKIAAEQSPVSSALKKSQRSLRLAVRWIFLLGVDLTFLGLGAVDMAPFVEMDRFTFFFSTTPIDPTLMLFVGFGFLIAGMLYIFIAISLFRPQLGAIMAAIILVALNVVFVVFLSILALPAVLIRGPFIFVFTGPLCVAALVRVILHLVMSFDSIHAQTSSGFASKGRNTRLYARLAPNIVAGLLAVFLTWFIWQRYKSR